MYTDAMKKLLSFFRPKKKNVEPSPAFPAFAPMLYFKLPSAIRGKKPIKYFTNKYYTAVLARGTTPIAIRVNQPFTIPTFVFRFYYHVAKMVQNESFITIFAVIRYDKKNVMKTLRALEKNKYRFSKTTYQYLFCKDATGICMYDTVNVFKDTRSLDSLDLDHNYAFMAMRDRNYVFYLLVANYIVLESDFLRTVMGVSAT